MLRTFSKLLAFGLSLGFASSSFATDDEIVIWHAYRGAEKQAIETVTEAFSKKVQGQYKVRLLAVPFDALADKISAAIPRGRGPDVFIFAQDRMGGWVEAGETISPVNYFLKKPIDDFFLEGTVDAMRYRDTIWGLPLNFKCITLIYNKKLIKSPPKSTSEIIKVSKSLMAEKKVQYGLAYDYGNFYYHAAILNAFGAKVFEPGPKPVIASEQSIKALETVLGWVQKDQVLPESPSTALVNSMFNNGQVAMIFEGPWAVGDIKPEIDWGLAMLPEIDEAGGKPMSPWLTIEGAYISDASTKKQWAYLYLRHLTSVESGITMALMGRQLPARKGVYKDPRVKKDPTLLHFYNQMKKGIPMENIPEMTVAWTPIAVNMNLIMKGLETPASGLAKAEATITEDIAALRRKRGQGKEAE
jgi:arabinogalactan oligomer/maltooligosaccharide transport system substrate-binding protein